MNTVTIRKTTYQIERYENGVWEIRKSNTVKYLSLLRGVYYLTSAHSAFLNGYGMPKVVNPIFN